MDNGKWVNGKWVSFISECNCGCCHVPDLGACLKFEVGGNGRCVYCDHGKECHPGKGEFANGPLRPLVIGVDPASPEGDRTVKVKVKKRDMRKRHKSKKNGG